ncbi:MAG: hypothetical protein ACK4Z6_01280 [Candidatus Methylomirabilales bacterium]
MALSIATQTIIALSFLLVFWYFVGSQMNRRRAKALIRWLHNALQSFGGEATIRWIGRSAFRIAVEKTHEPFRSLQVTVILEPREALLIWLYQRFRGQRDLLVLRGELRQTPRAELEIFQQRGRIGAEVIRMVREAGWLVEPAGAGLLMAYSDRGGEALARELLALLKDFGATIWRMAVRRDDLLISLPLTRLPGPGEQDVFGLFQRLSLRIL